MSNISNVERAYRLEIAEQDFLLDRADAQAEVERTHEFLAPLANVRYERIMLLPYPAERAFVLRLAREATPVFVSYTTRGIRNTFDELDRHNRHDVEPMHGMSD